MGGRIGDKSHSITPQYRVDELGRMRSYDDYNSISEENPYESSVDY